MARALSQVQFDVDSGAQSAPARLRTSDDPFRLTLLGDFGGRASRNEPRLRRDPILIEPDNFDSVMQRLGTGLRISAGGVDVALRFQGLDDFHPDHLYRTLPVFQSLRQARAELGNPATLRAAAAGQDREPAPSGNLLDQIVDRSSDGPSLDEIIQRIVMPHLVRQPDARQEELVAQLDAVAAVLMRAILGHPQFQALEAAWRSASFLLQRLDTGLELKLNLIDVTREEIVEATVSGHPQLIARDGWSVAACLHSFQPTEVDCRILASLAGLARRSGGPLLAGVHPSLMGCRSIAETPDPDDWDQPLDKAAALAWKALRGHPDACWIGLAMPRILLRLPYGRNTAETELPDFEEMPQPPSHEAYLWGTPAVACACLLGQAFETRGWHMHPGLRNRLEGLPVHNYHADGELRMTPCAEACLTDKAAEKILAQGVMPLVASKTSDSLLMMGAQSIADPPGPLVGPWT